MALRDEISQDAKNLALELVPAVPGTTEELWQVIEDTLDKVRADSYAAGVADAYEEAAQLAGEETT